MFQSKEDKDISQAWKESETSLQDQAKALDESVRSQTREYISDAQISELEPDAPLYEIGSPEENSCLKELRKALEAEVQTTDYLLLLCLRSRKYSVEQAAALVPKYLKLRVEYDLDYQSDQLQSDLATGKISLMGGRDKFGRPLVLIRMRFHRPELCPTKQMVRCMLFVIEHALRDPVAQQVGLTFVSDLEGVKPENLDLNVMRTMLTVAMPAMPLRLGHFVMLQPPAVMKNVLLPVVKKLMKPKLAERIQPHVKKTSLHKYVPKDQLDRQYGGDMPTQPNSLLIACLDLPSRDAQQ